MANAKDAMDEPMTCGRGLAENAALPASIGHMIAAMASVLEDHMAALDRSDAPASAEYEVYRRIAGLQRRIVDLLEENAREMTAARGLPMGRHDEAAMDSPAAWSAFEKYVQAEEELAVLLGERARRGREMLEAGRPA